MQGTLATALNLLAKGLRPFVTERLRAALGDSWMNRASVSRSITSADPAAWDAHILLLLMWDHWNNVFRHDLSFVERSLVSELREFRNRWAHQKRFTERDTYRCLDSIQRLLAAIDSPQAERANELRHESLKRMHDDELIDIPNVRRDWFTATVTGICGISLAATVVVFMPLAYGWLMALMVLAAFARLTHRIARPTIIITTGPRQCSECGRVYYGGRCPYCTPVPIFDGGTSGDDADAETDESHELAGAGLAQ